MSYQIDIDSSQVEAMIREMRSEPSIRLNDRLSRRTSEEYKKHFYSLNASRHKSGTKGFYERTAESVEHRSYPDGFTISIGQEGIRQRLLGGEIRAGKSTSKATGKPTKYLTIPASQESRGKAAGEFGGLTLAWGRQRWSGRVGPVGLVAGKGGAQPKGKGKRTAARINRETVGRMLYWLVPKVNQRADSSVLPSENRIASAIVDEATTYITRRYT